MKDRLLALSLAATLITAGCSVFRWSGYRDLEPDMSGRWSAAELIISTQPARARRTFLPPPEKLPETLYYADLGPDTIDVSGYPTQQQYNYTIFRRQCAKCHTLARSVNSPAQSRIYWRFHIMRMNLHSQLQRAGRMSRDEVKAILDFMEYDARIRKVQDKSGFEEQTEELKRRFDPLLKTLLEHMQRSRQPRLIPSEDLE